MWVAVGRQTRRYDSPICLVEEWSVRRLLRVHGELERRVLRRSGTLSGPSSAAGPPSS